MGKWSFWSSNTRYNIHGCIENEKLKVTIIVGTRPEVIRLSETIKKCDEYFDHVLVHTGQNWDYTLNDVFFKELELSVPDHFLGGVGNDFRENIGNIIAASYKH